MLANYYLKRLYDGKDFALTRASMLVGRGSSCDIPLEQGAPSREHARIVLRKEGLFVEDLHSTNGTTVNNRKISEPTLLHPGDVIKFSSEAFTVVNEDEADATIISSHLTAESEDHESLVYTDEDEDPDATHVQQSYPLPAGWSPLDRERLAEFKSDKPAHPRHTLDSLIAAALSGSDTINSAALVVFQEKVKPKVFGLSLEIGNQRWIIGRGDIAHLQIVDPSVSEQHAELTYKGGRWNIKDHHSTNGIQLNGKKVQDASLDDGDSIKLGRIELMFCTISPLD